MYSMHFRRQYICSDLGHNTNVDKIYDEQLDTHSFIVLKLLDLGENPLEIETFTEKIMFTEKQGKGEIDRAIRCVFVFEQSFTIMAEQDSE